MRWGDDGWAAAGHQGLSRFCNHQEQDALQDAALGAVSGQLLSLAAIYGCQTDVHSKRDTPNAQAAAETRHEIIDFAGLERGAWQFEERRVPPLWRPVVGANSTGLKWIELRMPNARGWPARFGGRWMQSPVNGTGTRAFMQQLAADCPACPIWPDPLDSSLAAAADAVARERMAMLPTWLGHGMGLKAGAWEARMVNGGRGPPRQVLGHIWSVPGIDYGKRAVQMALGSFNFSAAERARTVLSAGVQQSAWLACLRRPPWYVAEAARKDGGFDEPVEDDDGSNGAVPRSWLPAPDTTLPAHHGSSGGGMPGTTRDSEHQHKEALRDTCELRLLALHPELLQRVAASASPKQLATALRMLAQVAHLIGRTPVWPDAKCADAHWAHASDFDRSIDGDNGKGSSFQESVPLKGLAEDALPWGEFRCAWWKYIQPKCLDGGRGILVWEFERWKERQQQAHQAAQNSTGLELQRVEPAEGVNVLRIDGSHMQQQSTHNQQRRQLRQDSAVAAAAGDPSLKLSAWELYRQLATQRRLMAQPVVYLDSLVSVVMSSDQGRVAPAAAAAAVVRQQPPRAPGPATRPVEAESVGSRSDRSGRQQGSVDNTNYASSGSGSRSAWVLSGLWKRWFAGATRGNSQHQKQGGQQQSSALPPLFDDSVLPLPGTRRRLLKSAPAADDGEQHPASNARHRPMRRVGKGLGHGAWQRRHKFKLHTPSPAAAGAGGSSLAHPARLHTRPHQHQHQQQALVHYERHPVRLPVAAGQLPPFALAVELYLEMEAECPALMLLPESGDDLNATGGTRQPGAVDGH